MTGRAARSTQRAPKGALLLEVMLALAIFVVTGIVILSLVGQGVSSLTHMRGRQHAADLARSAMAKIEAGIETPEVLNGPVPGWTEEEGAAFADTPPPDTAWELQIETEPSTFGGLTLVTVTALRRAAPGSESVVATYTLRQLVRLTAAGEDGVGDESDVSREAGIGAAERGGEGR